MNFFRELIIRLFAKSPVFFQVIKYVSLAAAVVTGLPELLEYFGVALSPTLAALQSKAVAIAALVAAFIATLPVTPDAVVTNNLKSFSSKPVKKVSLPFTEKHS